MHLHGAVLEHRDNFNFTFWLNNLRVIRGDIRIFFRKDVRWMWTLMGFVPLAMKLYQCLALYE
jgi:hypothetical protein